MNLSNIKRIAFIPDFNRRQGYPEFGNHQVNTTVEAVKAPIEVLPKAIKVIPKWKRNKLRALKRAKLEFKKSIKADYKPTLLVSTKLD